VRWKLLLIVSLLSSLLGAGCVIFFGGPSILERELPPGLFAALAVVLPPFVFVTAASIFVYRHTSRRRKLQAVLTVLFAGFLTLALVAAGVLLANRHVLVIFFFPVIFSS
jgi:hypothetical protein